MGLVVLHEEDLRPRRAFFRQRRHIVVPGLPLDCRVGS
jgi:hypothetical protein